MWIPLPAWHSICENKYCIVYTEKNRYEVLSAVHSLKIHDITDKSIAAMLDAFFKVPKLGDRN